jgi:hypothetical protein
MRSAAGRSVKASKRIIDFVGAIGASGCLSEHWVGFHNADLTICFGPRTVNLLRAECVDIRLEGKNWRESDEDHASRGHCEVESRDATTVRYSVN